MRISFFSGLEEGKFTLTGECPHCRVKAAFMPVTTSWHDERPLHDRWVAAMRCVSCSEFILGIIGFVKQANDSRTLEYLEHYPLGKPSQMTTGDIPEHILDDFNEALRCRSVEAYNATTEMCRRSLQASCEEQGADPSMNIDSQIDWMAAQGRITPFLREVAHTIRLAGNRGAHPPRKITEGEADAVISFTREYFHAVYVSKAMLKRFDFSRSAAKKKP